jgi:hypothetical protein
MADILNNTYGVQRIDEILDQKKEDLKAYSDTAISSLVDRFEGYVSKGQANQTEQEMRSFVLATLKAQADAQYADMSRYAILGAVAVIVSIGFLASRTKKLRRLTAMTNVPAFRRERKVMPDDEEKILDKETRERLNRQREELIQQERAYLEADLEEERRLAKARHELKGEITPTKNVELRRRLLEDRYMPSTPSLGQGGDKHAATKRKDTDEDKS